LPFHITHAKDVSPFNSMLVLDGISHNGSIAYTSIEQAHILQEHWKWVFAARDIDRDIARQLASQHQNRISFADVPPPSVEKMELTIKAAKHSAFGPDDLLFVAWRAGGTLAAETLINVQQPMFRPNCIPPLSGSTPATWCFFPRVMMPETQLRLCANPRTPDPLISKNAT
jgi:hypothetical protein